MQFAREALAFFHQADDEGREPGSHVQRTPDGDFRYYMPLRLGGMCLECHGPVDDLAPAVRQTLAERYPAEEMADFGFVNEVYEADEFEDPEWVVEPPG